VRSHIPSPCFRFIKSKAMNKEGAELVQPAFRPDSSNAMLVALDLKTSQRSHLVLSLRHQFRLAIMPTAVVLLMVPCLQAFSEQCLIFASLASSAFLVYLDPEHPTNQMRTFLIAQGSAALFGFGSVSFLGTGFLASGVATVLTILLIITLDAMHPPAMSTALSFAFHTNSLKTLAIFGLSMVVIASLAALQKAAFRLVQKAALPRATHNLSVIESSEKTRTTMKPATD
jgi:CBS-domain-containing membrane protein